nr:copper chaperone PCu(A)C [Streptomyces scabichelini]
MKSAVRSAAAPLGACCGALALLVVYTATGAAGGPPPRITVVDARIVAPVNAGSTAAYFEIRNTGAARDTLLYADSPELGVSVIRPAGRESGSASTDRVRAVDVPAGGTVRMAPGGLGVAILDPPALKPGQKVRYNLWFRYSGMVGVQAPVTVR